MTTQSKDDVLRIAGEPVAVVYVSQNEIPLAGRGRFSWLLNPVAIPNDTKLYTEAQLLAMYAAGAEDMRERAAEHSQAWVNSGCSDGHQIGSGIRALPIIPANTEGEQG